MPEAFTVFWPSLRCDEAQPAIDAGEPLTVLYGGPHSSLPSFVRAGVVPGDALYPIMVRAGTVSVLGRMRVEALHTRTGSGRFYQQYVDPYPRWRFLTDGCMTEAVVGSAGTALRLDAAIPAGILRRLTYRSQRGTRTLKHLDANGRLLRSHGVQGIYRLDGPGAEDLDSVLEQPCTPVIPSPRRSRADHDARNKAQSDADFWQSFSRH